MDSKTKKPVKAKVNSKPLLSKKPVEVKKPDYVKKLDDGIVEVTLLDGRVATIFPGTGETQTEALRDIDGDSSLFIPSYMSKTIDIDGKSTIIEDFLQMNSKDYNRILTKFSEANF